MTPEQWLQVLGIVAPIFVGLVGAWGIRQKSNAKAVEAEANARVVAAETAQTEAQTQLERVKSEAAERQANIQMFSQQIQINQQFTDLLRKGDEQRQKDYDILKQIFDTHAAYLGNLIVEANKREMEAIGEGNKRVMEAVDAGKGEVLRAIEAVPARTSGPLADAMKMLAHDLGDEFGERLAAQFARRDLGERLYPFPDAFDKAWRREWIEPIDAQVVRLRRTPLMEDDFLLADTLAQIAPMGEYVRLITGRVDHFAAVIRDNGTWGWIPTRKIKIGGEARAERIGSPEPDSTAIGRDRGSPEGGSGAAAPDLVKP
jgi:hypothetical protein